MTAEVQKEVEEAFRRDSCGIREMASRHLESLLGTAALLDERLREPDDLAARATNFIEKIEANSRRSGLMHIRDNLVGWVAKAVSGDVKRIRVYLSVLAGLSEDREGLGVRRWATWGISRPRPKLSPKFSRRSIRPSSGQARSPEDGRPW